MKTKKTMPKFGDVSRAYLVMMWFLFGACLLFWVFTPINGGMSSAAMTTFMVNVTIVLVFILLFAPVAVLLVGIYACFCTWQAGDYWWSTTSLAVTFAFYLIWWATWYVLYGRRQKWASPTP